VSGTLEAAMRGGRISLSRPSPQLIDRFLDQQRALPLSYTRPTGGVLQPPAGFVVDQRRLQVGAGTADFEAVCSVLRGWKMFDIGWVEIMPETTPLEVGRVVAVLIHAGPCWWLNACRIVELVDGGTSPSRFGFSYGTLPGHAASGEERFLVEQAVDGSVWYDLRAFSRPQSWLAKLGYPLARALQKQAGAESMLAVQRAVARSRGGSGRRSA
jgi:uncharacterized protein (UPF0548 family)